MSVQLSHIKRFSLCATFYLCLIIFSGGSATSKLYAGDYGPVIRALNSMNFTRVNYDSQPYYTVDDVKLMSSGGEGHILLVGQTVVKVPKKYHHHSFINECKIFEYIESLRGLKNKTLDFSRIVIPVQMNCSESPQINRRNFIQSPLFRGDLNSLWNNVTYAKLSSKKIYLAAAKAIAELHRLGIIHGDIKFDNFLYEIADQKVRVRIADFGTSIIHRNLLKKVKPPKPVSRSLLRQPPNEGAWTEKTDSWGFGLTMLENELQEDIFARYRKKNVVKQLEKDQKNGTFYKSILAKVSRLKDGTKKVPYSPQIAD